MKKTLIILFISILALIPNISHSQDLTVDDKLKIQGSRSVSDSHLFLMNFVGLYRVLVEMPRTTTIISGKGDAENNLILSGRYLEIKSLVLLNQMQYASKTLIGFDTRINKFFMISLDNNTTYSEISYGELDAENKTVTFHGKSKIPQDPSKELDYTIELKLMDRRKFSITTFVIEESKKTMTQKSLYIKKSE